MRKWAGYKILRLAAAPADTNRTGCREERVRPVLGLVECAGMRAPRCRACPGAESGGRDGRPTRRKREPGRPDARRKQRTARQAYKLTSSSAQRFPPFTLFRLRRPQRSLSDAESEDPIRSVAQGRRLASNRHADLTGTSEHAVTPVGHTDVEASPNRSRRGRRRPSASGGPAPPATATKTTSHDGTACRPDAATAAVPTA